MTKRTELTPQELHQKIQQLRMMIQEWGLAGDDVAAELIQLALSREIIASRIYQHPPYDIWLGTTCLALWHDGLMPEKLRPVARFYHAETQPRLVVFQTEYMPEFWKQTHGTGTGTPADSTNSHAAD